MKKKLKVCNEFVEFARTLTIEELKNPDKLTALIEYNHLALYKRLTPDKETIKELFNLVIKEKENGVKQSEKLALTSEKSTMEEKCKISMSPLE